MSFPKVTKPIETTPVQVKVTRAQKGKLTFSLSIHVMGDNQTEILPFPYLPCHAGQSAMWCHWPTSACFPCYSVYLWLSADSSKLLGWIHFVWCVGSSQAGGGKGCGFAHCSMVAATVKTADCREWACHHECGSVTDNWETYFSPV